MNMNKVEKIRFVNALTDTIARKVKQAIRDGRVPAEWDGHELRYLLADMFADSRYQLDKKRNKEYENHMLVTDI